MQLFGLTGGIASGKSTAHTMFARLGAHIVDADAVYHGLLAPTGALPSPLARAIEADFGGVLTADWRVDRRLLAQRVFDDPQARRRLETIAHPAVAAAVEARLTALAERGCARALYDVPLLYERDMAARFAGVIVVWVPTSLQLTRLMARDGLEPAAARARLAAQLPLDDKRHRARWVIDNSGTWAATEAQVAAVWNAVTATADVPLR